MTSFVQVHGLVLFTSLCPWGLERPLEWYITETVIHHQPKLTRLRRPGRHFVDGRSGVPVNLSVTDRVNCENAGQ